MKNFIKQKTFNRDFLKLDTRYYTVFVRQTDGTVSKHEHIKNPFMYKKKVLQNLYVEDVWIVPE